jgi:hypothetical protein
VNLSKGKVMKDGTEEMPVLPERCNRVPGVRVLPGYVCTGHAHPNLLSLKPGEKLSGDECYLERFD